MAQEFKYTSIILGKRDIGEVDRLYFLYTLEKGLVKVVGKGVRKSSAKLAGNLETGNFSEVFVSQGRGKGNITGVVPVENFLNVRKNPDLLLTIFEIFSKFIRLVEEGEKDEKVFGILSGLLHLINTDGIDSEKAEIFFLGFYFKLLDLLGYKIEVERCVGCGRRLLPDNNLFSVSDGGVTCQNCSGSSGIKIKISPEQIKIIRIFLSNKLENLGKVKVKKEELRNIAFIKNQLLSWTMD